MALFVDSFGLSVNGICGIHRRGALFFFISLFIQECRYFFCMKIVQFLRCAWVYYRFQRLFRLFKVLRILYTAGALHISMKKKEKKQQRWIEIFYYRSPRCHWTMNDCGIIFFFFVLLLWRAEQFVDQTLWHVTLCLSSWISLNDFNSIEREAESREKNTFFSALYAQRFPQEKFRLSIYHFVVVVKLKIETFRAR